MIEWHNLEYMVQNQNNFHNSPYFHYKCIFICYHLIHMYLVVITKNTLLILKVLLVSKNILAKNIKNQFSNKICKINFLKINFICSLYLVLFKVGKYGKPVGGKIKSQFPLKSTVHILIYFHLDFMYTYY